MSEFKIIPDASDYKINKNAEVIRISNDKPVFVLAGARVILKNNNGNNVPYNVDELVRQLFNDDVDNSDSSLKVFSSSNMPCGDISSEEQSDTHESEDKLLVNQEFINEVIRKETNTILVHNNISCHISEPCEDRKRGRGRPKGSKNVNAKIKSEKEPKKEKETNPTDFKVTKEIQRILDLDEFDRIKICKLHMLGCSVDEIIVHLKKPKKAYATVYVTISQFKKDKKLQERVASIN